MTCRGDGARPQRVACRAAIALIVLLPDVLTANTVPPSGGVNQYLVTASHAALHAGEHARAEAFLTAYVDAEPENPLAPLLRLKLWWWGILEGRGDLEARLQADFERVRERAESRLRQDPDDVQALYALGEAHCTLGRLHGLRGRGWAALQSHRGGVPLLERALSLDPELVPALASLGVYHYYAARAPGFLRFLGRLFSVHGDRERGLQELWRAATTPGLHQEEATFFLIEVLQGAEDDAVEALSPALLLHRRHPRSVPFAVMLASVHLSLERPDLAVRVLEPLAATSSPAARAARFFVARTLCLSGRFAAALQGLDAFTAAEIDSVPWLAGWHAYYRGLALEQLGRSAAARAAFERARAASDIADSRRHAERALNSQWDDLLRQVRALEAALAWDESPEGAVTEELLQAAKPGSETWRRGRLALGVLTLRQGDAATAAEILRPLLAQEEGDEAWLLVRPRIRLLQALRRGGRRQEAHDLAMRLAPQLGNWGSNRQLELLVQTSLQHLPADSLPPQAPVQAAGEHLISFRFKDIGSAQVELQQLDADANLRLHPMQWRNAYWEVTIPLGAGEHRYRFLLDGNQPLPDAAAMAYEERADGLWSLIHVPGAADS